MSRSCPLCYSEQSDRFAIVRGKDYRDCPVCGLVYLSPTNHLGPADEKARYEQHENDPTDPGYREFLQRLTELLLPELTPEARGLDYGAGPAPALSLMLEEKGFQMKIYDRYFPSDPGALTERYDFITCTETAEHFRHPAREFHRFDRLLRSGGWIGVMTRRLEHFDNLDVSFANWHYRRDETHVCFYRRATMEWIGEKFGWRCKFPRVDVALFHKPNLLKP